MFFDKNDVERNNYRTLCASCNLPAVNRAYQLKGKAYYDGGLSDPIPVDRALRDGCDKVVVILTLPKNYFRDDLRDRRVARIVRAYPRIRESIIKRSAVYNRQLKHLLDLEREGKVLIVAPRVKAEMDTLGRDKDVIEKLYYEGYDNAAPIEAFIRK